MIYKELAGHHAIKDSTNRAPPVITAAARLRDPRPGCEGGSTAEPAGIPELKSQREGGGRGDRTQKGMPSPHRELGIHEEGSSQVFRGELSRAAMEEST